MGRPFPLVLLFAGAVVLAHFLDFSSWARWGVRSDLLHVLAFAGLGYGAMRVFTRAGIPLPAGAVYTLLGTLALGSLGEIAQTATSRDADLGDLVRDVIGAGVGVCIASSRVIARGRIPFALAGIFLLFVGSADSLREVVALWRARADLPLVDDFEDATKRRLWRSTGARFEVSEDAGNHLLCAVFREGSYPGVARRLPGDWSAYARFSLTAETPEATELIVRIHDREHDDSHGDRFNRTVPLAAGQQTLSFSLDAVREGPQDRELDLSHLGELVLFVPRPAAPVTICFDELRLHP